jgi:hypothetical protein
LVLTLVLSATIHFQARSAGAGENATIPEIVALAQSGKYEECLRVIERLEKPSAEQKVIKALCLLGAGQEADALTLATALSNEWAGDEEPTPFISAAMLIKSGKLRKDGAEFKELLRGSDEFLITVKGKSPEGDALVVVNARGQEEVKVPVVAGKKQSFVLPAGQYDLYYRPNSTQKPDTKSLETDKFGILACALNGTGWTRKNEVEIEVPSARTVDLTISTAAGKAPMFMVKCPHTHECTLTIYALPPLNHPRVTSK